jgi:hypothetical protein
MEKAEQGREGKALLYIIGGGILLGIASETILSLAVSAALTGIALNAWVLISLAIRVGKWDRVPMAAIGAIPAGLFDGVKVFVIGLLTRWASSFFS